MGSVGKQVAIYIGLLLVACTFSLIAPFYPNLAQSKGVPLWLIGIIFSAYPLSTLISSLLLGKYMVLLGRKLVLLSSFLLIAASMVVLSPIEHLEFTPFVILSFAARILGGAGAGCIYTSVLSVFISDYPDCVQKMVGRMEAAVGLGLILGPLLGTVLYLIDLLTALITVGVITFLFFPIAWKMIGRFKPYDINSINIDRVALALKPVIFIQKIFLTLLVTIAFMFSFGFLATLLEIHLLSFGLTQLFIALCFVLQSVTYFTMCMTAGTLLKRFDARNIMVIGMCLLGTGSLMLGPCSFLFPNNIWVVVCSLPVFSVGQSLCYRKS